MFYFKSYNFKIKIALVIAAYIFTYHSYLSYIDTINIIVLFKSLRNCKIFNKEILRWSLTHHTPTKHYLVLNKISTLQFYFLGLFTILSELNNIFHVKGMNRFTFPVKLIDNRRKTEQEKYWVTWFDTISKSFKALTLKICY